MSPVEPSTERLREERDRMAVEVGELTTRMSDVRGELENATRERDRLQHEVETRTEQARALRTALSRGEHVRDRLREELGVLQRQRIALEAAVGIEGPPRRHPSLMQVGPGRSALVVDLLRRIASAIDEADVGELSHLARAASRLAELVERDSDSDADAATGRQPSPPATDVVDIREDDEETMSGEAHAPHRR